MRGTRPSDIVFDDAQGFLRSAVLASAVRTGVFDILESGDQTVGRLASLTKLSRKTVRALVDALVPMGYVVRRGQRYGLSQVGKECLVRGGREYMGSAVDLIVHPTIWSAVGRFACGTRSVKGAVIEGGGTPAIVGSIDYWVDFAKQAEWLIERAAEVMAAALGAQNLTEETWILDVGCGSGPCALTLAAASPLVNAILVDRQEVLRIAGQHAKRLGVAGRVTMLPGDAFEVLPNREVDIVVVGLLLHHYDLNTCARLLRRLGRCLRLVCCP